MPTDPLTSSAAQHSTKAIFKHLDRLIEFFERKYSIFTGVRRFREHYEEYCKRHLFVKTLSSPDRDVAIDDIYVPLWLQSECMPSVEITSETSLDMSRSVLIKGYAGAGKSTILRKLISNTLRKGVRLPIFYELKNYKGGELCCALSESLKIYGLRLDPPAITTLLRDSNVTLFLDAFDECDPELRNELVSE
ncbi:MAG: hypothetical protein AAGA95_07175, partial [Pseudomonadota bacterium]